MGRMSRAAVLALAGMANLLAHSSNWMADAFSLSNLAVAYSQGHQGSKGTNKRTAGFVRPLQHQLPTWGGYTGGRSRCRLEDTVFRYPTGTGLGKRRVGWALHAGSGVEIGEDDGEDNGGGEVTAASAAPAAAADSSSRATQQEGARIGGATGRKAAARAAVAVVESRKRREMKERGYVRKAATTLIAMLNLSLESGATQRDAERRVKMFVHALGCQVLEIDGRTVGPEMDRTYGRFIREYSEDKKIRKQTDFKEQPNSDYDIYDSAIIPEADQEKSRTETLLSDRLIQEARWFNCTGSEQVLDVLRLAPNSTDTSKKFLETFGTYTNDAKNWMETGWLQEMTAKFGGDEGNLRAEISGAFENANDAARWLAALDVSDDPVLGRQASVSEVTNRLFSQLGEPEGNLVVAPEDLEIFANEVLSPWCEPTETLKGSSGLTLLRAEMHSDSGPSLQKKTEQMVEMLKPRLAEFGLDTRVRAFIVKDELGDEEDFNSTFEDIVDSVEYAIYEDDSWRTIVAGFRELADIYFNDKQDKVAFVVVPASVKPGHGNAIGPQGTFVFSVVALYSLFFFVGTTFELDSTQMLDLFTSEGAADFQAKAATLVGMILGLTGVRDASRIAMGWSRGIKFQKPRLFPSTETGIVATFLQLASYPKDGKDAFDVSIAGPVAGFIASAAALVFGLQMTAAASAQVLAGYPSLPSEWLQDSWLVGSLVDYFLHTQLSTPDIAVSRIFMHPLAIAGAVSMLMNAGTMIAFQGSLGLDALSAADRSGLTARFGNILSFFFGGIRVINEGNSFLVTVLVSYFFETSLSDPILSEDNRLSVTDPWRPLILSVVSLVTLAVLSPMSVQGFLHAPASLAGMGAESAASGLGMSFSELLSH